MHDQLYSSDEWISDANWWREASRAGGSDSLAFRACHGSPETTAVLVADREMAAQLGIRATPSFVYRDRGVVIGRVADSVVAALAGQ